MECLVTKITALLRLDYTDDKKLERVCCANGFIDVPWKKNEMQYIGPILVGFLVHIFDCKNKLFWQH